MPVCGTASGALADIELAAYVPQDYPLETSGAHVAEVEIDPDTGIVQLVNYTAVDDVGTVINPMIVEGQLHGGIVQGIGQALCENCVYDSASGQLLSGSFMDYCMPRADKYAERAHAHGREGLRRGRNNRLACSGH